jgi:DNA polymerase III epsilon subunit-like protein
MLDLETLSTKVDAAIVSIGACTFDGNSIIDKFYANIDPVSCDTYGRHISASTVVWWMNQRNKTDTFNGKDSLPYVLQKFRDWIPNGALVWGNGSDFDNAILSNSYEELEIGTPWKYHNNRCYRTIRSIAPEETIVRIGSHHNALDDALSQAMHLIKLCKALNLEL